MPSEREQALMDAVSWHEQQAADIRAEMARKDQWARENDEPHAGHWHAVVAPLLLGVHDKAARHFRRMATRARRRAATSLPDIANDPHPR